jgi:hypothetical protein
MAVARQSADSVTGAESLGSVAREHADEAPREFPMASAEAPPSATPFVLGAALFGGGIGALLALALHLRPLIPLAIAGSVVAVVLAVLHARSILRALAARAARIPRLVLDSDALTFVDGDQRTVILALDRRLGLTLLASPSRGDIVLAITHRDGIEYLAGRNPSATRHIEILARAITTPENDLPVNDRVPIFHEGDRLLDLVAALEARAPGALDRVFLSDAGMADVVLDGRKLRAGQLDFDLQAPLAWRAYTFQEGSSFASHSYQATQLRQGEREVVLVALSPTGELATPSLISPPPGRVGPLASEQIQRALARDLRLAHCLADLPPARAHRIAVDRLFVPRLRVALDLAPGEIVRVPRANTPSEVLLTPPDGVEQLRQSSPEIR